MRALRCALVLTLATTSAGCLLVVRKKMREVPASAQTVKSPLRVFLADGAVVVFERGAVIDATKITGRRSGLRYDVTRAQTGVASTVALDSVIGIEAFDRQTDPGLSLLASVGLTALTVGGAVALTCAADPKCFGSCPTIYSFDELGERLEAEAFSFSISPLLEGRDVDRLSVRADEGGRVSLEIRNEALETHFINHLELLEVLREPDQHVVPDHRNRPTVVGPLRAVGQVTDRDGRDVTTLVSARDGEAYSSSDERIAAVDEGDDRDWLDLTLPATSTDSVALTLRLRNSLLSTVLFYEFMLGRQGAGALDWMAREVEQIGNAVELGRWFQRTMGLRLEVEEAGGFREVARFGDSGPIAWKEMAFVVPTQPGRPTRVRLSFLVDEWRLDHVAWSPSVSHADVRAYPASTVTPLVGATTADLLGLIADPDEEYLVTSAGTAFEVTFQTDPTPAGRSRTFLLGSQGYYSEWVRPMWVRSAEWPQAFRPTDHLLPEVMGRWMEVKDPMESAFHATRIPVR
jgi:hypothetical protein